MSPSTEVVQYLVTCINEDPAKEIYLDIIEYIGSHENQRESMYSAITEAIVIKHKKVSKASIRQYIQSLDTFGICNSTQIGQVTLHSLSITGKEILKMHNKGEF